MAAASLTPLLESVASTIADYRSGEIRRPDAAHVERWIAQFDPEARFLMLEELDHVLKRTYISHERMVRFLGSLIVNEKFTGGDHRSFWNAANLLRLQDETKSQHAMLTTLEAELANTLRVQVGEGAPNAPYIYLDDALFGGGTIRQDLRRWIQNEAPTNATVHVVVLAYHQSGGYYSLKHLRDMATAAGKKVDIHLWRLVEFEDRLSYINGSDVLRPTRVIGDPLVEAYAEQLGTAGYPPRLRAALRTPGGELFRSAAGRDALEWELLRVGCRILGNCDNPKAVMRPLGVSTLATLGFGAVFVTHRNCPNNCPLAFWWGDGDGTGALGWYPLFPRRPPEDTAAFFRRLVADARQRRGSAKPQERAVFPAHADDENDEMFWETEARGALEHALEEVEFDFDDGVAVVPHERGQSEYADLESLTRYLAEVYDEAWYANVPFDSGEAVFDSDSWSEASQALDDWYGEELDRLGWR